MSGFKMSHTKEGDKISLSINGHIDEESVFETLALDGVNKISVDLSQVSAINSVGIREWIKWSKSLSSVASITIENCPKVVVDQVNMVAGFLPPNARIESFFVPYYSDDSGEEVMVLFKRGEHFDDSGVRAPEGLKDSAGNDMEIDVIEAKYFKFING
jgi:anti-anti-sigma regulatory factor